MATITVDNLVFTGRGMHCQAVQLDGQLAEALVDAANATKLLSTLAQAMWKGLDINPDEFDATSAKIDKFAYSDETKVLDVDFSVDVASECDFDRTQRVQVKAKIEGGAIVTGSFQLVLAG